MESNPIRLYDYLQGRKSVAEYDTLITAVSYESRGNRSVEIILDSFPIHRVYLIVFGTEFLDESLKKRWILYHDRLLEMLKKREIEILEIGANSVFFDDMLSKEARLPPNNGKRIINITTFPKNWILRLARDFDSDTNLFFYHRADYRSPTQEELDIGIDRIIPILGFEGVRNLRSDDLLVLILGFEGHRAISFTSRFSPSRILPLISIPGREIDVDREFYRNVEKNNYNLLRKHSVLRDPQGMFYQVSSLNHLAFCREIEQILKKFRHESLDICVSPLGTKVQALGLYLYWRDNQDVQLIYSVPIKRLDLTSTDIEMSEAESNRPTSSPGSEQSWIYLLPATGTIQSNEESSK